MDISFEDYLRYSLKQFISIGFGLLEAFIVILVASLIARMLRRSVRRRLGATLAPENAKRIVENLVTLGAYGAAAPLLLTLWGATWTTLLTAIALRTTVLRAADGTRVVAPNSFALTHAVVKYSPDRAVLAIVNVHGAGGGGRTLADTQALVEAALAAVPGFTARPEVAVRSRIGTWRVPRPIARIPRLGERIEWLVRAAVDQATQVRVS